MCLKQPEGMGMPFQRALMENNLEKHLEEFVIAAHRVAGHGLVVCGSGNLSWHVNDDHMLITAANSWMDRISKDQIALCRIDDGTTLNGKRPAKEIGFHTGILRERMDINVVLHFQSPCATTIACRELHIEDFSVIPEIPYYIGPVAVIPYLTPGSPELSEAVTTALKNHDLAILRNHGQVTVGKDFDSVIKKAAYFELACRIILGAGGDVQSLSKEAVAGLQRRRDSKSNVPYG
jgi:ribulose-5-phosphate 4-epimerase/fuculose-1-phosphate aldolase